MEIDRRPLEITRARYRSPINAARPRHMHFALSPPENPARRGRFSSLVTLLARARIGFLRRALITPIIVGE